MTSPNITPGPWTEELPSHGFHDPIGSNGDRTCFINHGIANATANARAIAAVPALLEALEMLVKESGRSLDELDQDISSHKPIIAAYSALIAAGYQF